MMSKSDERDKNETRPFQLSLLELLFSLFFTLRASLILILQGRYSLLQSNYSSTLSNTNQSQLQESMQEHRLLMRKFGIIYRDLGPATMLGFSAFLGIHLIFVLSDSLTKGFMSNKYRADKFVMTLINPPAIDREIDKTFDEYLRCMIRLNDKKLYAIVLNLSRSVLSELHAKQLMTHLSGQQAQLKLLLADKSTIWPVNRQASWRQEQKKFLISLYILICSIIYLGSLFITFLVSWYTYKLMVEAGETPLYFMERFGFFEIYVAFYYTFERVIYPMIMLTVNLRDKRLFLLTIQRRFKALRAKLIKLKLDIRRSQMANSGSNSTSQLSILSGRKLDALRLECDQEALRIYLSIRAFIDDLRSTTRLITVIANQYCSLALFIMIVTLPFLTITDSLQLAALGLLLLDITSVINVSLVICARHESTLIQTTEQAHSLVASLTPIPEESQDLACLSDWGLYKRLRYRAGSYDGTYSTNSHGIKTDDFLFHPLCSTLINQHTTMLWRRFVSDMPAFHQNLRCKMLGVVHLNYGGMIRLNFWFISVILTYLGQQRSRW